MKRVLVTGGSGLVGQAIKKVYKDKDTYDIFYLSSKDCDLTDWNQTLAFFEKTRPNYVIHLAANVGGLFKNMAYKVDMLEKNVMINVNVLKASHMVGVERLVACLSTCIFPDKTSYPINEKMLHNGPPHFSNDAYSYAKRLLEVQCKSYQEQYNDKFVCVIPTNIYGIHDNFNLENSHVIPGLIHKCYLAKKENKPFVISGTGKPLRQFIYSEDLAKLILWVMEDYILTHKETIILSVDEKDEVSIRDVSLKIASLFEYDNILFDETKSDGQYKKTADNSKLKSFMDFEFTPIDQGLKNVVEWFTKNYEMVRK
jgi:GDP-L-fucose synthase